MSVLSLDIFDFQELRTSMKTLPRERRTMARRERERRAKEK